MDLYGAPAFIKTRRREVVKRAADLLRELGKPEYQTSALHTDRGRRAANKLERLMAASARLLVAQNDWASRMSRVAMMEASAVQAQTRTEREPEEAGSDAGLSQGALFPKDKAE